MKSLNLSEADAKKLSQLKDLRFVRRTGLLIRKDEHLDDIDKTISDWLKSGVSNKKIEYLLNYINIWDEFPNLDDEASIEIAKAVKAAWKERINSWGLDYDVVYSYEEADYGPTVSFFRKNG